MDIYYLGIGHNLYRSLCICRRVKGVAPHTAIESDELPAHVLYYSNSVLLKIKLNNLFTKMKKQNFTKQILAVAITLFLMGATHYANAQFGFSVGPKGGVSISTFNGTDADNIDSRSSWFGGLFLNFQLAPAIAIQPELLLTERGADVTTGNVRDEISINYFEVPVLLKFRLPLANDIIFPHILLGPNFAFRTDLDFKSTDTQSGVNLEANTDDIKKSDISGLVGAGVDIQTPGNGVFFTIDGRYGFGFSDINDNDNAVSLKHRAWTFAVGVGFRIGNRSDGLDD